MLYLFGGRTTGNEWNITIPISFIVENEWPQGIIADVIRYDPNTNTWETLAPLPFGRNGFSAEPVGDSSLIIWHYSLFIQLVFVFGGEVNFGDHDVITIGGSTTWITPLPPAI